MKRQISYVVWNLFLGGLMVAGLVYGNHMAWNIWRFVVWVETVLAVLGGFAVAGGMKPLQPSFPLNVMLEVELVIAMFLAAMGRFGYATLIVVGAVMMVAVYRAKDKEVSHEK